MQSIRNLMKQNKEFGAHVPSVREMSRHTWFRNKLGSARLRLSLGQALDGDQKLVDECEEHQKAGNFGKSKPRKRRRSTVAA